jgi:hypothetical protein
VQQKPDSMWTSPSQRDLLGCRRLVSVLNKEIELRDSLFQLVIRERVGMCALSIEFLFGELSGSLLAVRIAIVFALLTLVRSSSHTEMKL